jgi:AbrB family looped-hinge helix DNA binding protein
MVTLPLLACEATRLSFTDIVKVMPRISTKNQVTIPVAVLAEAGLRAGDHVVVEALEEGELRVRRGAVSFERAFGALTGTYPPGYLERLDREDAER